MTLDAFVHIYALEDSQDLMLVSNNGDVIETVLAAVRSHEAVERVEVDDLTGAAYYAPSPDVEGEHDHGPFKYRAYTQIGTNAHALAQEMEERIQHALDDTRFEAEVVVNP